MNRKKRNFLKMARRRGWCGHCIPPGFNESLYPYYGMAPHAHIGRRMIGSTVFTGDRPKNFIPDPDADGQQGIWFCPKCGHGRPEKKP